MTIKAFDFLKGAWWAQGKKSGRPSVENRAPEGIDPEIVKMLDKAWQVSPLGWALLTLSSDPLFKRIPKTERIKAAETALQCGTEEAGRMRSLYGDRRVREIAGEMGVEIGYVEKNRIGSYLYFSQYFSRPPRIELFQPTLDEIGRAAAAAGWRDLPSRGSLEEILLAHELYHHLETIRPELATSTYRIKTWKLAGYQAQSNLVSLGEIGAFSFAQELLRLPYFPRILELVALSLKNREAAGRWLGRLKEWETVATAVGAESSGGQFH